MKSVFFSAIAGVFLGVPALRAQNSAPASSVDQAHMRDVIGRLGDSSFERRDAAQKELEQSGAKNLDFLRSVADATSDTEIRTRLYSSILNIEDGPYIHPGPISLALHNATAEEVGDALSKATRTQLPLDVHFQPRNSVPLFDLQGKEQPFWDVFFLLAKQHPMRFRQNQGSNQLNIECEPSAWRMGVISGPLAIVPGEVMSRVDLQAPAGSLAETIHFGCTFVMDPRVNLIRYGRPRLQQVVDDAGNNLIPATPPDELYSARGRDSNAPAKMVFSEAFDLRSSQKVGARIVSAKGTMRFVCTTIPVEASVDKAEQATGQFFDLGAMNVQLKSLERRMVAGQEKTVFEIDGLAGARMDPKDLSDGMMKTIGVVVTDAQGHELYSNPTTQLNQLIEIGSNGVSPRKIVMTGVRTREFTVPFELKDLPLP